MAWGRPEPPPDELSSVEPGVRAWSDDVADGAAEPDFALAVGAAAEVLFALGVAEAPGVVAPGVVVVFPPGVVLAPGVVAPGVVAPCVVTPGAVAFGVTTDPPDAREEVGRGAVLVPGAVVVRGATVVAAGRGVVTAGLDVVGAGFAVVGAGRGDGGGGGGGAVAAGGATPGRAPAPKAKPMTVPGAGSYDVTPTWL